MYLKSFVILFVMAIGAITEAKDFEPLSLVYGRTKCWPDCVGKFCCDDYCSKPLPCFSYGKTRVLCDDYCRKPLPCSPLGKTRYACDDYCRKSLPPVCHTSGKNLVCIPNRLPPIDAKVSKDTTATSNSLVPSGEPRLEVLPASSRRVYRDRPLIDD